MDEEAGAARGKMAAESKARKATAAKALAAENEAKAKSLAGVTAKTDDGGGLQTGGEAKKSWL